MLWWVYLLIVTGICIFSLACIIILSALKTKKKSTKPVIQNKIQERIRKDREKVRLRMEKDRERLGLVKKEKKPIIKTAYEKKTILTNSDKIKKVKEILIEIRMKVPMQISRIVQLTKLSEQEVTDAIKHLIAEKIILGDYLELENVFIKTEQFKPISEVNCFYCGNPLTDNSNICTNCSKEILKCSVCKLPISFGEEIGSCSLCEVSGHLDHLQEWVKTQGKCPNCLQEIPEEGIFIDRKDKIKK